MIKKKAIYNQDNIAPHHNDSHKVHTMSIFVSREMCDIIKV